MAKKNTEIIIKRSYFDNIQTAITSINFFFESGFKTKNFPVVDSEFQLDSIVIGIISWFNSIEPSWIDNPDKIQDAVDEIREISENIDGDVYAELLGSGDSEILDSINAYIGYRMLQYIADNFEEFESLMNGLYSFELFTKPTHFKSAIDVFSEPVPMDELEDILGDNKYYIFNDEKYIHGLFDNDQIKFPGVMKEDTELNRFRNGTDISDEIEIIVDDTVQEAAEIDYFTDFRTDNFKYDKTNKKFVLSKKYKSFVSEFISEISKCENTDQLLEYFQSKAPNKQDEACIVPFIIMKVLLNPKKFPKDQLKIETWENFSKSYESIVSRNGGAKRFYNYDLFSVFKIDKQGTIDFLRDYLDLTLFNDPNAVIHNNTLLTIFNIFDSRIYLDVLYRMIYSEDDKDAPGEDSFVKEIRARINTNSRQANIYKKNDGIPSQEDKAETSNQVQEYVSSIGKSFGDMSISDIRLCDQYQMIVEQELRCIGDRMYNLGVSPKTIEHFIGESFNIMEAVEDSGMPDYIKSRIVDRSQRGQQPDVSIKNTRVEPSYDMYTPDELQLPPDEMSNEVNDLIASIDAKLKISDDGTPSEMLGSGFEDKYKNDSSVDKKLSSQIIYNINNNYTYNTDNSIHQNTTNNDSSSGKVVNDNSRSKHVISTETPVRKKPINNYNNNSDNAVDTKEPDLLKEKKDKDTLSTGVSIQELFSFLDSEEPLSTFVEAVVNNKPPKEDLLTTAMDADRKLLNAQQKMKRGVQYVGNVGKAVMKSPNRTKQWLTKMINSLIKRDEDTVKAEIIENPSYRSAVFKAARIALKLGLTKVFFVVNPYIGAAYLGIQALKIADKDRLRGEVQHEINAEIQIIDQKLEMLNNRFGGERTEQDKQEIYDLMRAKQKLQQMAANAPKAVIKGRRSIY